MITRWCDVDVCSRINYLWMIVICYNNFLLTLQWFYIVHVYIFSRVMEYWIFEANQTVSFWWLLNEEQL